MPEGCRPASRAALHAQAGAVSSLHPCLYAGDRPTAGRSRSATLLPGHPAFGPPDGAHPRTQRADPTPTRHRSQHRGTGRTRSTAAPSIQPRSTRHILCDEVLVGSASTLGRRPRGRFPRRRHGWQWRRLKSGRRFAGRFIGWSRNACHVQSQWVPRIHRACCTRWPLSCASRSISWQSYHRDPRGEQVKLGALACIATALPADARTITDANVEAQWDAPGAKQVS